MALPPYLITMVLPWYLRIYGRARARVSALSWMLVEVMAVSVRQMKTIISPPC